ncbi:MAG: 4Fe-4S binding protein, partial [Betaproteobacteria bacterium]
ACDADAIRSAGDTIAVDPHLCQGCAACTLACPTGALSFVVPSRSDLMQQIDVALATAAANGVAAPALIIHAAAVPMLPEATPPSAQAIEVDALPAFGDELWLTALARGASAVALVDDGTRPPRARAQLERRIAEAQAVLAATGAAPSAIALVQRDALPALAPFAAPATVPTRMPATTTNPTKRAVVLAAIDALLAAHRPTGDAPLPAGSTFGDVVVDVAACTLCLACVQLCPTAALRAGTGVRPALDFVEAECVQCSLCATGCPEHAIRLAPRLLHDRIARNAARTLAEDELFPCPNCGTPFIGRKLLERSIAHLRDHPVLRDGGLERLRLCPECRTRAALDAG